MTLTEINILVGMKWLSKSSVACRSAICTGESINCCSMQIISLQTGIPLMRRDGCQQQFDTPSSIISGPIDPVVDHCGFTRLVKDSLLKQTWPSIAPSMVNLDSAKVWLSS